jgi:ribonuclease G
MSKELIVSSLTHETKAAILEDDELVEVYFEREKRYGLAGSIYKGRVTRVLPGMQSAFVDIGLDRDAFLYVSDFFEDNDEYDRVVTKVEEKVVKMQEKGELAPAAELAPAEAEPAEAEAPETPPAAPVPAVAARAEEAGNDRWARRGRRGRGRRGARGFPEAKYAPAHAPEPVLLTVPKSEPAEPSGFAVLPGESLAKYSRTAPHEAVEDLEAADSGEPEVTPEVPEPDAPLSAPEAAAEEPELPVEEPEPLSAEPDVPEPVSEEPCVAEAAVGLPPAEPAAREPVEPAEAFPGLLSAESLEASPAEPAPEPIEPEMLLAEAEEAAVAGEAEDFPLPAETSEEGASMAREMETAEAPPEGISEASVRERTYGRRYLHRGSRRLRRRGRPEGRDRKSPERPAIAAPAVETEPAPGRAETSISDLLREGQEIIVQIAKEPLGKKGARITSHLALPGRYLVYMPTVDHAGVSRKIQSEEERHRLKRLVLTHRVGMPGGFIVRTAGEGRSEDEIRSDMMFLYNLWLDMRQKAERKRAPALIHHDLELIERLLRDQLTEDFKTIWVDNQEDYELILHFVERFQPGLVGRVKLYTRPKPVFDEFGVTAEMEKALRPKVWLKSGGYIVINQTEALVAIDVNTGKYVGKSNRLEDTIVKTNLDAVKEIVRQIRLRDLGGIIVVDFIDMDERKNRQKVMQALDEALRQDRSPSKILQFNDFGLVAITRKRVKQSLERTLCSPCPYCEGAGYVKSVETMIQEILIEARKLGRNGDNRRTRDVILRVNPEVAKVLKSRDNSYLEELEALLGRAVLVKGDPQLHQEKFDFD